MDGNRIMLQEAIAEISKRARGEDDLKWSVDRIPSVSPPMQHYPLNCCTERCNLEQQQELGRKIAVNWIRMVPELSSCWSSMSISLITPLSPLQLTAYEGGASSSGIGNCLMEIVRSMWSSRKHSDQQESSIGLEAEEMELNHRSLCRELELEDRSRPPSSSLLFHAPDSSADEDDSLMEDGIWEWEFSKYDSMDQACFPCWEVSSRNASSSDGSSLDDFLATLSKRSSGGYETADEQVCGGSEEASFATSPANSSTFAFIPSPYYSKVAADRSLRSALKTSSCYTLRADQERRPKRVRFWDQEEEEEEASCWASYTSDDSTDDECFSLNYVSPIWAEASSNTSSSSSGSNEWRTED